MTARRLLSLAMFSLVLQFVIVLSGYSQPTSAQKKTIFIGGVPSAWVASRIQDGLVADAIGRKTPYDTKIVGGLSIGSDRFVALQEGKIDITIDIQGHWGLYAALRSSDPKLATSFQYLALFPQFFQPIPLIVHRDLPLTSLRDAIEKKYPLKIGVARIGSVEMVDQIWKIMGAPNGVFSVEKWGGKVDKSATPPTVPPLIREGVLNAEMLLGALYEPQLEACHSARPLKALPVAEDEKTLQLIKKEMLNVDRYVMKAGYYTFITQDTPVIGSLRFWIASPKLSNEIVYTITKGVWEEREFLATAHQDLADGLRPERIQLGRKLGIPFHPGAERYYREKGLL